MYIDVWPWELLSTHYWPARPERDIGQIAGGIWVDGKDFFWPLYCKGCWASFCLSFFSLKFGHCLRSHGTQMTLFITSRHAVLSQTAPSSLYSSFFCQLRRAFWPAFALPRAQGSCRSLAAQATVGDMCTLRTTNSFYMHQPGIEPGSHRWQRCILPLDHWCCWKLPGLVMPNRPVVLFW